MDIQTVSYCHGNLRLSRLSDCRKILKKVSYCIDSCRLLRQLQTVKSIINELSHPFPT